MIQTSAAQRYHTRAIHYASARQDWRHSKPYLELDDCTIDVKDAPRPCPLGIRTVDSVGIVEYEGVVVIVPSPWISERVNSRIGRFWRSFGFELRTSDNSPHVVEGYVKEWVCLCDTPLRGRRFSAKAWLDWVTRKHKEFYL